MNIEVNRNAKAYAIEEMLIHAPVEKVYGLLSDINNWTEWQTAVTEAQLNGNFDEGIEFRWKANGMNIHSKLHTFQQNAKIGWTGKMFWIKAVHNWWVTAKGESTIVKVEESLSGFGSSLMKKSLAEGMTKNLIELKKCAEKAKK
jgi:hypothetical protein